jgi:hypothetical protein
LWGFLPGRIFLKGVANGSGPPLNLSRPLVKNEGYLWIKRSFTSPAKCRNITLSNAIAFGVPKEMSDIIGDKLVIIPSHAGNSIHADPSVNNYILQLMAEIVRFRARPSCELPAALIAMGHVKSAEAVLATAKGSIQMLLPFTLKTAKAAFRSADAAHEHDL